ncbi:MAG TPA: hypothetical protein VFW19_14100 [Allosphingosinicella sp.]|nr:hypothetical protein [Allosphingosinicella sp.]
MVARVGSGVVAMSGLCAIMVSGASEAHAGPADRPPAMAAPALGDGAHDFDFELGTCGGRIWSAASTH